MALFPETNALQAGYLPEDSGHQVFWETFGNPSKPAILLLHGGPGGGVSPRMPRLFDPDCWYIIALDQRGAGRSRPHAGDTTAALESNQTKDLIADIERLRCHLSIENWFLYGSSWGATLAQAYAHTHMTRVSGMILAAVTSTSQFEIDFLYGGAGHFLPEAFEKFQAGAPIGTSGIGMCAAYGDLLMSDDPAVVVAAATNWCAWEETVLKVDPRAETPTHFSNQRFSIGFARVVTHYFRNLAWVDSPLLEKAHAFANIPVVLINSRTDLSTPLSTAWSMHKSLPSSKLVIIPGSLHGTLYGPLSDAVIEAGQEIQSFS
ncbi:alpha/beta fold hydrolase [uncultured Roseobacter sp.]|uniref:alpha/beta fold hydrolase n=1 Tax=uncultured Roseobacter sp. TaxID=114847 RepID=UPI00260613AF|nr:alpha/beta fold hydrolase [uncultured Roseobacter sp.]